MKRNKNNQFNFELRYRSGLIILIAIVLQTIIPSSIRAQDLTENEIKTGFVYNFIKLIDFPGRTIHNSTIYLCISGNEKDYSTFLTLQGKIANGSKIALKLVNDIDLADCNVLYIPGTVSALLKETISTLPDERKSILIIGNNDQIGDVGGTIKFYMEDDRIRFQIYESSAENAGLAVSSKLMALAKVTK